MKVSAGHESPVISAFGDVARFSLPALSRLVTAGDRDCLLRGPLV